MRRISILSRDSNPTTVHLPRVRSTEPASARRLQTDSRFHRRWPRASISAMPSTIASPACSRLRRESAACPLRASAPSRMAPSSIAAIATRRCPAPQEAPARGLPARWVNGSATRRPVALKFDGTDVLSPYNGTRSNEKNILDFGAIASTREDQLQRHRRPGQHHLFRESAARISRSISTLRSIAPVPRRACRSRPDSPRSRRPPPILPSSATRLTRYAQGCTVQNALAWCTAGSAVCASEQCRVLRAGTDGDDRGSGRPARRSPATIATYDDDDEQHHPRHPRLDHRQWRGR